MFEYEAVIHIHIKSVCVDLNFPQSFFGTSTAGLALQLEVAYVGEPSCFSELSNVILHYALTASMVYTYMSIYCCVHILTANVTSI